MPVSTLQQHIGGMVATASKEPLPVLGPKGNLDRFAKRLDHEHLLLLYIEWSPTHKANAYHASLSRDSGRKNPDLAVALAGLMAIEGFLGAPALYVFEDRLVHWYWLVDGPGAEAAPAVKQ